MTNAEYGWNIVNDTQESTVSELTVVTTIPEDEMEVRSIFGQVADKIVEASRMRKELAQMREEIRELRIDHDTLRRTNHYYAEEIETLREKHRALVEEKQKAAETITRLQRESDEWQANYHSAHNDYQATRVERDEANHRLAEALDKVALMTAQVEESTARELLAKDGFEKSKAENVSLEEQLYSVKQTLIAVQQERDNVGYRVLELEESGRQCAEQVAVLTERASRAEGKLSAIRQQF